MTRKTIDEAYFHISNSGFNIRTVEKTSGKDNAYKSWTLEYSMNTFGIETQVSIALSTIDQIDMLRAALENVQKRMADYGKANVYNTVADRDVAYADGYKVEKVWKKENGSRELLGYNLNKDGEEHFAKYVGKPVIYGYGSSSSDVSDEG